MYIPIGQNVYTYRAKCIYLSNDMYIPIGGKVYKFQRGLVYLYEKYMEESIPMSIEL